MAGNVIGAVIGFVVTGGNPAGAQWGWVLGGIAEAATKKGPHTFGPRVEDLKVQASTYGTALPLLFGTNRVAGNVIFSTDKRQVATTTRQSGKGGGSKSTTFSYNVDIAISLAEGPIAGVRKMWADGELFYDVSPSATAESIVASDLRARNFTVYLGTEDQMPDPTMEATVGAGLTPAYRGTAYVMFEQLDCPGGRIPQLTFEVVGDGSGTPTTITYGTGDGSGDYRAAITSRGAFQFRQEDAQRAAQKYQVGPNFVTDLPYLNFTQGGGSEFAPKPVQGGAFAMSAGASDAGYSVYVHNLETGVSESVYSYQPITTAKRLIPQHAAIDPITGKFCVVGNSDIYVNTATVLPGFIQTDAFDTNITPVAFYDDVIYTTGERSSITYLKRYSGTTGEFLSEVSLGAYINPQTALVHADANGVFVLENPTTSASTNRRIWKVGDSWELLSSTVAWDNSGGYTQTFYANDRYCVVGPHLAADNTATYYIHPYGALGSDEVNVADVIEALCERAGMDAATEVVTIGITDTVHGYGVNRVTSARSAIDPLLKAYFIDVAEIDGALTFSKRADQTVEAEIPFEELGAVDAGADAIDAFPLNRMNEGELPRSLALTYINVAADYQPGTETARRQITSSTFDATEELAIATTADHMAGVVHALLYDAWNARNMRKLSVSRAYANLDVGDNVSVEYPEDAWTQCRIQKLTDTGARIEMDVIPSTPALWDVTASGATPDNAQGVSLVAPTVLRLLDIGVLRDVDDGSGVYAAMCGAGDEWNGSVLNAGVDANTMTQRGGVTAGAVIGQATTALASFTGSRLVDETNTVTVRIQAGELASITREALTSGTSNLALLGDELIQFGTPTDEGDNVYTLSSIRRGLHGTEHAITTHAIGDRFVLLEDSGLLRVALNASDADQALTYQAVSIGQLASQAPKVTFTNTDVGLKPIAPANLTVAYYDGNYYLRWVRRTRHTDNWLLGTVPLGESSESWEIDVTTGGTTTTYTSTTNSKTLALGTGSLAGTVIEVFQVSAAFGRGFSASITL